MSNNDQKYFHHYKDMVMDDYRCYSCDPKDWDAIDNLNATYPGYYNLPDFYMKC